MRWIDAYFYRPNFIQKCISIALLPICVLFSIGAFVRRKVGRFYNFPIPIVSVGNLIAGGSGKTPFIIEVAKDYECAAIVSRGYKRTSKGLVVVSQWGKIQVSQAQAGDEPYLMARELNQASVIVCKNRVKAIEKAIALGAKVIFLDDGFRFRFAKLNIVLEPLLKPYFRFCLPSGIYRELPSAYKDADIVVQEGKDYTREVEIESPSPRMLLLTAIANPARLDAFLPSIVGKITLKDHARFDKDFLTQAMKEYNATSLLVTSKDEVKLLDYGFKLSVMRLRLHIDSVILEQIRAYVQHYKK
ncbi:tetraacyldisaccharide 4'-kinase [Helicobacter jaachi]|uniref:Tetraacyldisaccharide 4'-kinase n=1 Tax=Helicobacter jaachi TaxID=1677920 RepID=A0A4U8T9K6_9HELI|nr:tetraacyldisaccharide 4'-kinase [Helicobacter jaachi]TLD96343.1 tetraacyldisaccharide 4'-kinase [Helicobacter jaachi]